jgi:hypothetical protein
MQRLEKIVASAETRIVESGQQQLPPRPIVRKVIGRGYTEAIPPRPFRPQGQLAGLFFSRPRSRPLVLEPDLKRLFVFVDGQNLFHAARSSFGIREPNYDVRALSELVAGRLRSELRGCCFYTGMPSPAYSKRWYDFWAGKLTRMHAHGVDIVTRPLVYRVQATQLPDGAVTQVRVGQRRASTSGSLDVVRLAREDAYDVAVLFSQDQGL